MDEKSAWDAIEREAAGAFDGAGRFPLRAYSEYMPAPYVGIKPYAARRADAACTAFAADGASLDVTEYEQHEELAPGLARVADHVVFELTKLVHGEPHALSRTLLADNPAWPAELADAARAARLADEAVVLMMPLALSRTQDDKGNDRWTLFGASHDGPARAFWRSFQDDDAERFLRVVQWAARDTRLSLDAVRVLGEGAELPAFARARAWSESRASLDGVRALVTFEPFSRLPRAIREAYLARELAFFPSPASLVFFEHPRYRELARTLPRATQIPLLHLFPRVESAYALRIPQSGWLDERDAATARAHGHRVVSRVARTHRWQRVPRDADVETRGDGKFTDEVTVALFSTKADDLGLYGKPMARNAQVWTADYRILLDGPRADRAALAHAARVTDEGGRFGYRFLFPAMRAGTRELFWHLPLVARALQDGGERRAETYAADDAPRGYVGAEPVDAARGAPTITLSPRLLARDGHVEAATLFAHERGRLRLTTSHNARKLLDMRELIGAPLAPSFARALVRASKELPLGAWLASLAESASDPAGGARLAERLRACVGAERDPGDARTLARAGSRAFEEHVWRTIAELAEGQFRAKENADAARVNAGKSGGPAAKKARVHAAERRDLARLGDHLHARYRELVAAHGMEGRAECVDHVFRWETDFDYDWSLGWANNQSGAEKERNVVLMIPGKNRGEALIMADHYDTAYMEDVYEPDHGGDTLRVAAAGADDNHSATTALLCAADALLPLSRAGQLERDVWLVHLTGEEFPGDSLGARALVQAALEKRLAFTAEDGAPRDVSAVRIAGAYVLDMIGHNTEKDRDVFQIAPGEGAASARLALYAHLANLRWNRAAAEWNRAPARRGPDGRPLPRAQRMPDGTAPPPPFSHLSLSGEVRVEWEPRSALYNTDGQVFSDVGIPVVLFMENYDISRTGYHDTHDTMENIDLDYCAALTAIAIESVAEAATAPSV